MIDRSKTRGIPLDPSAAEGRSSVWNLCRGNHLGQRSCASATTGRTYGRKRSDQSTAQHPCEERAVHIWIKEGKDQAVPALFGDFVRYRLLEALAYISTEIHKSFKPYFTPGATEDAKAASGQTILKRLNFIAEWLNQDYLLGAGYGVADAYLFVMLMWAYKNGLSLPVPLPAYYERMKARPAVQRSLKEEGLL